jgi:hypothetical protein
MPRRGLSAYGAGGRGDLRLQIGVVEVLDHAHADDVDDLALIARHPPVEKSQLGALHRGEAGDMALLHRSCSGSPLRLAKGSTAIDGLSGRVSRSDAATASSGRLTVAVKR